MAKSLLEALQKKLNTQQQAQPTNFTQGAARLIGASSGQVPIQQLPTGSTQEATANLETQQQLTDTQMQNQIAGAQIGQAQQKLDQDTQSAENTLTEKIKQARQQLNTKERQLEQDYRNKKNTLTADQKQQMLEQLGFTLSMQDDQYLMYLQDIGRKRRLEDEITFRTALKTSALKDQEILFRNKIIAEDLMSMNERQFNERMDIMTVDDAAAITRNQIREAGLSDIIDGLGKLGSEALDMISSRSDDEVKYDTHTSSDIMAERGVANNEVSG